MKTVTDAVKQENGVWCDDTYNAMAWLSGLIDYVWRDSEGVWHYCSSEHDPLGSDWQRVCTREEFEAEAKRLGYGKKDEPEQQIHYCRSLSGHVCADGAECRKCITPQHNPVTSPAHYTSGNIECIYAIREALTPEEFRGFCKGNVIKYSWRERAKGGDEDLKKAAWYAAKATDNE